MITSSPVVAVPVIQTQITSIDGLTAESQTLAIGSSGTDFSIVSSGDTHTFNIPTASTAARGLVTTTTQTFGGVKNFANAVGVSPTDGLTVNSVIVPTTIPVTVVLNALNVSTAIFVADAAYQVVGVRAVWGVAGGAAAVLGVEKLTGTTAPGGGTAMLTGSIDLTATANTVVSGTLSGTQSNLQLAAGNRLGIVLGGVLTGLVGCAVTVLLKRI